LSPCAHHHCVSSSRAHNYNTHKHTIMMTRIIQTRSNHTIAAAATCQVIKLKQLLNSYQYKLRHRWIFCQALVNKRLNLLHALVAHKRVSARATQRKHQKSRALKRELLDTVCVRS